jgi:hypothetical protein
MEEVKLVEEGLLTDVKEPRIIRRAIEKIIYPRGFKNVRANIENFEPPARLQRGNEDAYFIPDITAEMNGQKSYFEIAAKTAHEQLAVTKWKLLSQLASLRRGALFLIAPFGHYTFAERLVKKYNIKAKIIRL